MIEWRWDWSPSKRKAWILDEHGFTVVPPCMSKKMAKQIVEKHNQMVRWAKEGDME